jgi:hypothetical protein
MQRLPQKPHVVCACCGVVLQEQTGSICVAQMVRDFKTMQPTSARTDKAIENKVFKWLKVGSVRSAGVMRAFKTRGDGACLRMLCPHPCKCLC